MKCISVATVTITAIIAFEQNKKKRGKNKIRPLHNLAWLFLPADAQVRDFLLHAQGDVSNSSQGAWLQQTCTLFVQSGVRLLAEFTQHAAAWVDTRVVRASFSQPGHARSPSEPAGHGHGKPDGLLSHRGSNA